MKVLLLIHNTNTLMRVSKALKPHRMLYVFLMLFFIKWKQNHISTESSSQPTFFSPHWRWVQYTFLIQYIYFSVKAFFFIFISKWSIAIRNDHIYFQFVLVRPQNGDKRLLISRYLKIKFKTKHRSLCSVTFRKVIYWTKKYFLPSASHLKWRK